MATAELDVDLPTAAPDDGEETPAAIRLNRFKLTIRGTQSLLMHNVRLANPLDPIARAMSRITSKRKKTDEDREELAKLEFHGGLYIDDVIGPYLPAYNVEAALYEGGKITRSGMKIKRGVFVEGDNGQVPLFYPGPRTAEELWQDEGFRSFEAVRVGVQRVMRTRPMFRQWALEAEGTYDPSVISLEELGQVAENTGMLTGLGDFRPRFGRFRVDGLEEV